MKCSHLYTYVSKIKNRVPKDRDFEEGEFERLYASLPTFEYIFEKGMNPLDPLFMSQIVEEIKKQNPEFEVSIDSINAKGMRPSIKFSVNDEKYKKIAEEKVREGYEKTVTQLKGNIEALILVIKEFIKNPRKIVMGDEIKIEIAGNVENSNVVGTNKGTQTWSITKQIKNSRKLDDKAMKWLMNVAERIKAENLPDDEKPVIESKVNQLQSELEKDQPDKNIVQRAWSFLAAAAPTIKTLTEVPPKIASLIEKFI